MKTYTLFQKYFLLTVMALCAPSVANAMFPTFDASNTKTSIETNVNVVKQTKEIQNVKEMSGKINSSIGSVTSSISKFRSENLEKIQEKAEKIKKEKERLEKKKAEIEKIKKDAEKYKAEVKEMKEQVEDYRRQATDLKNTATSTVKDASAMTKDVSSLAKTGLNTATSAAGSTFGVSEELSAVQAKASSLGKSSPSSSNYINSDDKDYSDDESYAEEGQGGYVADTQEVEEVQKEVIAPTRASFGRAPKVAVSGNQTPQAARVLVAPATTVEPQATYAAPVQARSSAGSVTQAQSQMQVQNPVAQARSATEEKATAPTLTSSDTNSVRSGAESSMSTNSIGTTAKNTSVSTKKEGTKPKVTHGAFYNNLNLVSKRKSVMGAQAKPVNSRIATQKATQTQDSSGRKGVPVTGESDEVAEKTSGSTGGKNIAATSSSSTQSNNGIFFADEYAEEGEVVDENEVVSEKSLDENDTPVGAIIPAQKLDTKVNTQRRRVPFGSKINPAELEKELKALEAEEALEKKGSAEKSDKQSFKFSEKLVFAQLGQGVGATTVHDNYVEGKFALSAKFVNRCKKDAKDLADVEVLKTCIAEFVSCIYDPSEGTAKACRDELNEILGEQALATLAEALQQRVVGAGLEEKVLKKNAEAAEAAKNERADFSVVAVINEETVKVINDNTGMLAMEVILKSMMGIKDIKPADLDVVVEENRG